MKKFLCYIIPFYLSSWGLGQSIPGLGLSVVEIGTGTVFLLSPVLLLTKALHLRHKSLFLGFILLHAVVLNPFSSTNLALKGNFVLHLAAAFLLLLIMVNLVDTLDVYSKMVGIFLVTTAGMVLILVYLHWFVYESAYLTGSLTSDTFFLRGRGGKNTLAFLLAVLFPFAYSRFTYRRSVLNSTVLTLITFGALYTVSRMALISMVASTVLFAVLGTGRVTVFRRQLGVVAFLVLVVIPLRQGTDPVTAFMQVRSGAPIAASGLEGDAFIDFEGQRMSLLLQGLEGFVTSPLFGRGLGSFREDGRSQSHNDYIRILYELGLIGFLPFMAIFWVSFRDLRSVSRFVPPEHQWLRDGQIVAVLTVLILLVFMNAYETVPVWFVLAGSQIIPRLARRQRAVEPRKTNARLQGLEYAR